MNARFHAPGVYVSGDRIPLPEEEAEHLTRVLRLAPGSTVRVFDGRGHEFDAVVETVGKREVIVRIGEPRAAAPEPRVAITLAQAVLKGDKMDDVVRDAVMIGVAAIQPIVTTRTEVSLATLERGRRRERWHRIAVASAKQCGRATVPPVLDPIAFETLISRLASNASAALICAEPSANATATPLSWLGTAPAEVTLVVGPEGGWTAAETERAAMFRVVTFGGRTLRAEVAPIVAVAALFAIWQEY